MKRFLLFALTALLTLTFTSCESDPDEYIAYSLDGKTFKKLGTPFAVKEGKWIGAKVGFFNSRPTKNNDGAFLDIDWIKFK